MGMQNILLIDDDIELCSLLKEYLVDEGFELEICHELPGGLIQLLIQMSHALFLRIAAALSASGLVCFLMVRYLTSPIRKLQAAVRKFA